MFRLVLTVSIGLLLMNLLNAAPFSHELPRQRTPKMSFSDTQLYEGVIQHIFTSSPTLREERLRYTYAARGEMQIVVRPASAGFHVEMWRVPPGLPTVWEQLEKLWRSNSQIAAAQAAKQITIEHLLASVRTSEPLGRALAARPLTMSLDGGAVIVLEAARYESQRSSISKATSVSLQAPQDWQKSQDPIVQWMGKTRVAAEQYHRASGRGMPPS